VFRSYRFANNTRYIFYVDGICKTLTLKMSVTAIDSPIYAAVGGKRTENFVVKREKCFYGAL